MPLPNAKGRRPAPVIAVGLTPLPTPTGPNPVSPEITVNGGAETSASDSTTLESPAHSSTRPGRSPLLSVGSPQGGNAPGHKFTVTIVSAIDAGACGEVSVIKYEDPSKGKSELRVMKEMDSRNTTKCDREKAQFNRQSCHPNMIKYFYYGPSCTSKKNTHTQVQMELMDLGSLKTVIDTTSNKLTLADRCLLCETVGYQIFMALDYFHFFHGGMHRDVKPANILLNIQGRAKLCDFDASVADSMIHDTVIGTTSYAAPEVIAFQPHDFKCDVWSAGTVLFELAAGKHPYMQAESGSGGMIGGMISSNGVLSKGIDWTLLSHMPFSFTELLKRCLTEDQSHRYTSAEAIVHPFFANINKERRRDSKAEAQLRKLGIDVDPDHTEKMHLSWKNFVATAEGGGGVDNSNKNSHVGAVPGGARNILNQRTASSLGEEQADELNVSVLGASTFGSPGSSAMGAVNYADAPASPEAGPLAKTKALSPSGTPITPSGGPVPGSPEAKERAMKVSNVMKSVLYNWEYASVSKLQGWLKEKQSELKLIVTPSQMRELCGK